MGPAEGAWGATRRFARRDERKPFRTSRGSPVPLIAAWALIPVSALCIYLFSSSAVWRAPHPELAYAPPLHSVQSVVSRGTHSSANISKSSELFIGEDHPPGRSRTEVNPEVCTHSCIQMLNDACLTPTGALREPSPESEFEPLASLMNLRMRDNPHHAVHEDLFPLIFQLANGCIPEPSHLFVRVAGPADHCPARYETILLGMLRHSFPHQNLHITHHPCGDQNRDINTTDANVAEVPVRCFRQLAVILNPLRSSCVEDPEARDYHDPPSDKIDPTLQIEDEGQFRGKHGLGLRVSTVKTTSMGVKEMYPVPDMHRQNAFLFFQNYLQTRHRFKGYNSRPFALGEPVRIVVIDRGSTNVTRRRQTNAAKLSKALGAAFPAANISVAAIDQTWPALDQMRIFHDADILVGVHGGALGGVAMMRKGAALVTQCYGIKCTQWETSIANVLRVSVDHVDYTGVYEEDDLVVDFMIDPILRSLKAQLLQSSQ